MTSPRPSRSVSAIFSELETARRQPRAIPTLPEWQGITCVALTSIILAYGAILGPLSILVLYMLWLPRYKYKGVHVLTPSSDIVFAMLLPMLAIVSTVWSDYRMTSLYTSLEYTSLILCTLILAKITSTESYIKGMIVGCFFVLVASLASGRYGVDPFSGNSTLVGLFGSKNSVGFFAEIGIIFACFLMFNRKYALYQRAACLIPVLVFALSLYRCKSASSVLSLGLTLAALLSIYILMKLPRAYRLISVVTVLLCVIGIGATGLMLDWQESIFKSFGKDSTLTGRTSLWEEGIKSGMESPIVGHGYSAFWVRGNQWAEKLWYKFEIYGRGGFHFHNLYVEVFSELGLLGLMLIICLLLKAFFKPFRLILKHGLITEYAMPFAIAFMLIIRSMVEVDLIGTFAIGPVLLFSILPRLANYQHAAKAS